jgi:hypothetical protein
MNSFDNIYIIDSFNLLNQIEFNIDKDLCLTFDFALVNHIKNKGGNILYIDNLIESETMNQNNFKFYEFFKKWHYDLNGRDIFVHKEIDFGFALRLEIWNDLTYKYNNLIVGTEDKNIIQILNYLKLKFKKLNFNVETNNNLNNFYFPIHQWLDEKVRYKGSRAIKYVIRDYLSLLQSLIITFYDKLFINKFNRPLIYVQEYHPTKNIINKIYNNKKYRVLLATFSKSIRFYRYIPIYKNDAKFNEIADNLISTFLSNKHEKYLINGIDISDELYDIIVKRIRPRLSNYITNLDYIINYLNSENLKLIVLVTNIGKVSTLIDCVGKHYHIPRFLIINGYMSGDFLDESKHANFFNSYSISIKNHFYKNMNNVFCLGDPRMDKYANIPSKDINRNNPTITIGTSAHSIIDLNSFVAVEFEFMFQVLGAIASFVDIKDNFKIIIKVRPNGYIEQYQNFISLYFPFLNITILDSGTMKEIFNKTDLYISLYSQTLIEASCIGIPVIYHKNDKEKIDPPFDNNSELVTTTNTNELIVAIDDFLNNNHRFSNFLKKEILEKYIGPLDGKNIERNLDFIYDLVNTNNNV